MPPGDSDAKIDALIASLDKLAKAMDKKSSEDSGSPTRSRTDTSSLGEPGSDEYIKQLNRLKDARKEQADQLKELEDAGVRLTTSQRELMRVNYELAASEENTIEGFERSEEAAMRLHKEYEAGASKAKQLVGNLGKVGGAFESLAMQIPLSAKELSAFGTDMIDMVASGDLGAVMLSEMFNLAVATADAGSEFVKATGAMDDHTDVIGKVRNEYQHLGVDSAAAGAAASGLFTSMMGFSQLSKEVKTELAGQAAVMQKLNINAEATGKIFDTATKSLGFADNELVGLTEHLNDVAVSVGKGPQQVFADFASVSKKLAFYGKDVVEVFDQLEKQSKATGLSVDELVSISGKAFDTFDGAGQKVGRLNAILGGPYLNSIDMLNASEAERLEMLTDSVEMSGQLFSDMNKYEQLAIADALGVDVDQARRMFGELSAAEELQIKHQEEIAETAKRAQTQADKLKNAFAGVFVALEPLTNTIVVVVDFLAWLIGSPGGKILLWFAMLLSAALLIAPALMGIGTAFGALTAGATSAFAAMMSPWETIKAAFRERMGIDQMHGPELPEGGLPGTETSIPEPPAGDTTSRWEAFTEGIKKLGEAVKGTWKEMLAFGAAILMIGVGIAAAAYGLSYLVKAFQGLTGAEMAGAIVGMIVVFAGFAVAIVLLGKASLTAVWPMIALGAALLLMGVGIAIAAYGMSVLVGSFAQLKGGQLIAAGFALGIFSIAVWGLVAAAAGATAAAPALLAMAGLLAAIGVAALLMGIGINIAAKGLTLMVEALVQIPPDQIFALAMAVGKLGISLITLGIGSVAAAAGLGILAIALALAAIPLTLGSYVLALFGNALMIVGTGMMLVASGMTIFVAQLLKIPAEEIADRALVVGDLGIKLIILGVGAGLAAAGLGILAAAVALTAIPLAIGSFGLKIFGAALMTVGLGMTMVAAGAGSLASSVMTFSDVLPQLREFTDALKGIGGSAFGILKTAAALTALTYSLGPFALALALLQLKKLEALTAFNQSATLTVKNVQKPAIPNEAIAATGAAMDNSSTPSKGGPTKPVINFSQKSIVVKIGEKELQDVFIEFLKHPEVANAISGMGN